MAKLSSILYHSIVLALASWDPGQTGIKMGAMHKVPTR